MKINKYIILLLCALFLAVKTQAESVDDIPKTQEEMVNNIGVFGGIGTDDNIQQIMEGKIHFKSGMVGVSAKKDLVNITPSTQFNVEGQLIQHFKAQTCQEITMALLIKASNVFNAEKVPLNFTIGDGLSLLVGSVPKLESHQAKPRRLLNYFFLEAATPLPRKDTEIFFRWHHRCHMFGLMAPNGTGSNFFLLGVRFKLEP